MNKSWVCQDCGAINPKEQLRCHKCNEIRVRPEHMDYEIHSDSGYKPRTELREMSIEKYGDKDNV